MVKTFFKTAWRNMLRNKTWSILNILGTGVALAACIVIFLVLQREYSYDTYHHNAKNIYQLVKRASLQEGDQFEVGIPFAATKALRNDYPDIKFANIFTSYGSQISTVNPNHPEKFVEDKGIFFAEPELFQLFDVKWITGSPQILAEENTAVLSRSMADKYFGGPEKAMNQYIKLDNSVPSKVEAIIEDVPANTDFPFRVILSYKTFLANSKQYGLGEMERWGWDVTNHQIYALLPEKANPETITKSLQSFVAKYNKEKDLYKKTWFFRPLSAIHFDARFGNNGDHISSKASLNTLTFIGILILLMACINFINLSTALAVKRSKEVGVRKVMGSSRMALRWQVFAETGLIVLLAMVFALTIAANSLPYLKHFMVTKEPLQLFNQGSLLFMIGIMVITTILSGSYPAFTLSRFNPIDALKNKINTSKVGGISLRRILVVLQFSFSQLLIIATIIAVSQMNFIRRADLGFNKEAVLLLYGNNDSTSLSKHNAFKNELRNLPGVQDVSFGWDAPASTNNWQSDVRMENTPVEKTFKGSIKFGDADYIRTFGLHMVAGRNYRDNDTAAEVVVNQTLVSRLGLRTDQAVGKLIQMGGGKWRQVVGVVEDFKANSLREAVPPMILLARPQYYSLTAVKLKSNNIGQSNERIEAIWNKYYPEYAYTGQFLDDNINNFYQQERQLTLLYKVYAALAILISCLGLYGLVSFMAVQKTREIGVRKVLGASTGNILYLFSKEFTVLILVAFCLAAPAAWYLMNHWLQEFRFRVHPGWGVFLLAIGISVVLAWLTVGYRSLRAALANPVKSLRTE